MQRPRPPRAGGPPARWRRRPCDGAPRTPGAPGRQRREIDRVTTSRRDERRTRPSSRGARDSMSLSRVVLAALALLWPLQASAQGNLPDVAPLGAAPQPGRKATPSGPEGPETHAAEGGTESTLPAGNEPSLPSDPLAISPEVAARIGSDA